MYHLYLDSLNQQGEPQPFCLVNSDLDLIFEALSLLAASGCSLRLARLSFEKGNAIGLPVAAFDGTSMRADLAGLQQQWEEALSNSDKNPT